MFRGWAASLPADIDVIGVQYPGRGIENAGNAVADCRSMVQLLARGIGPMLDLPFYFFGHSNGALISFELARNLDAGQRALHRHHFLSARVPAHVGTGRGRISDLPDREFLQELGRIGGTPGMLLADAALMRRILPRLRADFALGENYTYTDGPLLDCDITSLHGQGDGLVDAEKIPRWSELTRGRAIHHVVQGDHFFLESHRDAVLEIVRAGMRTSHSMTTGTP